MEEEWEGSQHGHLQGRIWNPGLALMAARQNGSLRELGKGMRQRWERLRRKVARRTVVEEGGVTGVKASLMYSEWRDRRWLREGALRV